MTSRRTLRVAAALLVLVAPARTASADEVTDWNQTLFRAALIAGSTPLAMTRLTAIVQASVYDAVNGIAGRYTPLFKHTPATGPAGASQRAAAMQAAYVALVNIYPAQKLTFDAHRMASLADISARENSAAVAAGLAWGEKVANDIWAERLKDGIATAPSPWLGSTAPGQWRQTPNDPLPGISTPGAGYPQFVGMTTWVKD